MSEDQVIIDPSDLRKYRTELPNLYDDSGLDVYEFRLLAHYKRVGTCNEGLPTTARICQMSEGKVSQVRQSLADKKFIMLTRVEMDAGRYRFIVQVIDRWIENFAKYSGLNERDIADQIKRASPSPHEGSPSPHEGKKELNKNLVVVVNDGENFKIYEREIGPLTPMIADAIKDAENTYAPDWIPEAITIAVESNKRSWKYIEAILRNCKATNTRPSLNKRGGSNGNNGNGNKPGAKSERPAAADYSEADRKAAERIRKRRDDQLAGVR